MTKFNLFRSVAIFVQKHKKSKALRGTLVGLASVTVFTTTYALILPALTLEKTEARQMPGLDLGEDAEYDEEIVDFQDEYSEDDYLDASWNLDAAQNAGSDSVDYLIDDEDGISDDEWDELLEDGAFFLDEDQTELFDGMFGEDEEFEALTEQAETLGGEAEVQPEQAETLGAEAEVQPEQAETLSGETGMQSEQDDTLDGETEEQPEQAEILSGETEMQPEQAEALDREADVLQEQVENSHEDSVVEKVSERGSETIADTTNEAGHGETDNAAETETTADANDAGTQYEGLEDHIEDTIENASETSRSDAEEVTEALTEEVAEEATEALTDEVAKKTTEALTEEVAEETTEALTEEVVEETTQAVSEDVTEEVTEENTSEEATESITEGESETTTEAETETFAEAETESLTEGETVAITEIETETITEAESEITASAEEEITEEITETTTEEENVDLDYPAQHFEVYTKYMYIQVVADEGAFPEGTTITIDDIEDEETLETISSAVEGRITKVHAVDITFRDTKQNEIEPRIPIQVTMTELDPEETIKEQELSDQMEDVTMQPDEKPVVVHIQQDGETQLMEAADTAVEQPVEKQEIVFEASSFSIYALVYTVDFHWEVDGKIYSFSMPGGGYVSFEALMEVLGVAKADLEVVSEADNNAESNETAGIYSLNGVRVSEATKTFVEDVESVVFSDPKLVWVEKNLTDTTVGDLKAANNLDCQYSSELTKEEIEEINSTEVQAGDWALISMFPFTSEESLTVSMKNGEVFTIKVTDAQDPFGLDGQSYEIVWNGNTALNSVLEDGVSGHTYLNDANVGSGSNLAWKFEYDENAFGEGIGGYFISHDGNYIKMVGTGPNDAGANITLETAKENAAPISVHYDKTTGKYSFSNTADASGGFLCHMTANGNNGYFGISETVTTDSWMELKNPNNPSLPGMVTPWDIRSDNIILKFFDYTGKVDGNNDIDDKWGTDYTASQWRSGTGVNNNRTFLFTGGGRNDSNDPYNYYTGDDPKVMQGIVKNHLAGGYPELTKVYQNGADASLGYLFGAGGQSGVTEYSGSDGKGLKGLLRKNEDGYYYYSSEENFATLVTGVDGSGKPIIGNDEVYIYSESYNKDRGSVNAKKIGLFPFDPYRQGQSKAGEEKGPNGSPYNHQFGMTLEATFVLPPDGKLPNGDDMQFNFSGDDDVWVFIDDVLVLDLGGVHQPLSGTINFAGEGYSRVTDAGVQKISGQETVGNGKTLAELFEAAGEEYDDSPYSTHTIKFFYLERGGCDSNCTLSFNLLMYKTLTVAKELEGLTDEERAKYANNEFTCDVFVNGEPYNGSDTIRYDATGKAIDEGFEIVDGKVNLKPGERVRIIGLSPKDTFYAAEENGLSMTEFYPPRAERIYQDANKNQHEEEVDLEEEHTSASPDISDWKTQTYPVENLEELMFTNTLKEKNLDVEKTWSDGADKHSDDEVKFRVAAKVKIDDQEYDYTDTISAMYSDTKVQNQKIEDVLNTTYTLSAANDWKAQLEHLPGVNNLRQEIFYEVVEVQTANGYASSVTGRDSHNIDVAKIFPENHTFQNEEILFKLRKGSQGNYQYYNETNKSWGSSTSATIYTLNASNNYTKRFHDFPAGTYSYEEVGNNEGGDNPQTDGLVVYDRALKKFDILNGPFEIEVKKTWNPASCANDNVTDRKVEVELGRYVLMDKEGNLTIRKEGVPEGALFRATYTVTNTDTNEIFGVYPYVPGGLTVKVPEGRYKIEETILEDDPAYNHRHGEAVQTGIAVPDEGSKEVVFTSEYTPVKGNLIIKSTLDNRGTNVSFANVYYEVYDANGTKVKTVSFAEASAENGFTFETQIGQYLVKEVGLPETPNGVKTVWHPKKPANGNREITTTVRQGEEPAVVEFSAAYTKKAKVTVTSTKNSVNKTSEEFYVGDTIRVSYTKNNGETIDVPSITGGTLVTTTPVEDEVPTEGNGWNGRYHVDIKLTDSSVAVRFTNNGIYNGWSAMNNDNVQISFVSSGGAKSPMLMAARRLTGLLKAFQPTYRTIDLTNSAQPPQAPDGKKYVNDGAFSHDKIILQYGKWSEVVKDLPSVDANGNPYYYYIKSVHEENMPETTVSQITMNGEHLLLVGSDNATTTDLEVTNTIDTTGDLKIQKTGTVNGETPTDANKQWIDGDYTFTVTGKSSTPTASNHVQVKINLEGGVAVSAEKVGASVPENVAISIENGVVTVKDLPEGDYSVAENLTADQSAWGIALASSDNTEISVYAEVTTDIPTAAFVNNVNMGNMNVEKSVTFSGHEIATEAQGQILAGTYKFMVYTDENCSADHAVKINGQDLILTAAIEADGQTKTSETISLPTGTYWVKEIVSDDALILPVGENKKSVTIVAGGTETVSAEFTNDYDFNEEDDDMTVDIVKQFTGLVNASHIPEGYRGMLTFKLKDGTPVTVPLTGATYQHESGVHVKVSKSDDELTWKWHVYRIPKDSTEFRVYEENYTNPDYHLTVTIDGNSVDPDTGAALSLTAPTATFTPVERNRITAQSTLNKFYVSDDYVLMVSVNPHGTVVLSNSSLNYLARAAIRTAVESGDVGHSFDAPVSFFSTEQHQTVIKIDNKRSLKVTNENGRYIIEVPPNSNSQVMGFEVKYDQQDVVNNAVIVNNYTGNEVPVEIIKVDKDTMDQPEKDYLKGAEFTITQLEETGTGEHKVKPESTTTPKELFYQETIETNGNGKAVSSNLKTGYYEIAETKSPDGYIRTTDEPFYIKVQGGTVTRIKKTNGKVTEWPEETDNSGIIRFTPGRKAQEADPEHGIEAQDAVDASFLVGNERGAALPNTGGPGTDLNYLIGIMLTGIAGTGLVMRRRRKAA